MAQDYRRRRTSRNRNRAVAYEFSRNLFQLWADVLRKKESTIRSISARMVCKLDPRSRVFALRLLFLVNGDDDCKFQQNLSTKAASVDFADAQRLVDTSRKKERNNQLS